MKKRFRHLLLLALLASTVMAQAARVTGVVTGEDGLPAPGVNVIVKGTNMGVVTGTDGSYSLNAPDGATTLVFSSLEYASQEQAISGSEMNVAMTAGVQQMDEVVVSAMGVTRSKKSIGYAASNLSKDDLTGTNDRSMMNALQGKVAGVNVTTASGAPGASTRVIIRGATSLSGSNQPLYVVDGVPVNNSVVNDINLNGGFDFGNRVNDINPEDVESMTILKGSSATALYGSRAANGVIMITTKKGSKNDNGKVEFVSSATFDSPLRLPYMQNEFGQGWYNQNQGNDLQENGSWGPKFDGKDRVWGFTVNNEQRIKPYKALKTNVKDFFDVGHTLNNSVSFSNGNEKYTMFLSYSNITADGIMPSDADAYKRNSLALRASTLLWKNFTASGSLNYIRKNSNFVITGQDQSVLDGVWQNPRDISIVEHEDYNATFNTPLDYYTVFAQNPYWVLNEHGNDFREDRVFGNASLEYKIFPFLTATYRIGGDFSNAALKEWHAIYKGRASYNDDPGSVAESSYYSGEINSDLILNFQQNFADAWDVNVLLGHNLNQREMHQNRMSVTGLSMPNFYHMTNSSSQPVTTSETSERRLVGVYGSAEIGWRKMAYLNLMARNDWSSTLPSNTRSFFYPGANASFIFTELIEDKSIISFGKFRIGLAQTGNDADPYMTSTRYARANYTDGYRDLNYPLAGGVNGFTYANVFGSDNLKPELTTEFEVGADIRFLDNRIGIDFAYYDKTVTNLIWDTPSAPSTGFAAQVMNLGKISNKGIELGVTLVPIRTTDWQWRLLWTFTRNRNKLVELTEGLDRVDLGGTSSIGYVGIPGQPLGLFEGQGYTYSPTGQIVVDASGLPIPSADLIIYGNSQYDFITGLTSTLSWKGLSLLATIDYRKGGYMYSRTAEMMYFTGNAPQTTYNDRQPFIIPNSVTYDPLTNTYSENTTPIAGYTQNLNSYYAQNAGGNAFGKAYMMEKTFFKLRELSLNYTLPKQWFKKTPIKGLELSVVGRNLFIWTPRENTFVDPESTTFGNDLEADFGEYGAAPTTRSFGGSIRLTF